MIERCRQLQFGIKFEIFEDGSRTKSDPLFSCLSKESRCAMHHGKPVFFLLILLLPFGPLPIPPADHVASPILLTNYNLSFNIHYVQNILYTFQQKFDLSSKDFCRAISIRKKKKKNSIIYVENPSTDAKDRSRS